MQETNLTTAERVALLAPLNLTITSQYIIPHPNEKFTRSHSEGDYSQFKYAVSLAKLDKSVLQTDYFMGIGNVHCVIPVHSGSKNILEKEFMLFATPLLWQGASSVRSTDYPNCPSVRSGIKAERVLPVLRDVLYCLHSDKDILNYTFNEWASDFGYSNDSISARDSYLAGQMAAQKFVRFFTVDERKLIAEACENY